jgi:3-oxoacyl-[acyl-carrier-protein] synthase-1
MFDVGFLLPINAARPLAIQSLGLFSSAGTSVSTALGSALLGLKFFEELSTKDAAGDPIIGARTPLDLDAVEGADRLATLGALALGECIGTGTAAEAGLPPAPLLLCLPEPAGGTVDPQDVLASICHQAHRSIDVAASRVFSTGRAAIFDALEEAEHLLSGGTVREVYVGGVDSLVDRDSLDLLLRAGRIRTSTTEGFVPGEGAGFLRLGRRANADTRAVIAGLARGHEPSSRQSDQPNAGDVLARVAGDALAAASLSIDDVGAFVHDAAGDRFSFREAAMALTRLRPRTKPPVQVWTPASCAGELGAAYGCFALALAAQFLQREVITGAAALVLGTSEGTARGAALVTRAPNQAPSRR